MSWEKTTMSVTHGWKSFEKKREKKPLHVLWRRLACDTSSVLYTHAPESSSSYYVFVFTSLKAREWELKRLWVRFFLEGIDQVQFFYTVNLGGELKGDKGEKKNCEYPV